MTPPLPAHKAMYLAPTLCITTLHHYCPCATACMRVLQSILTGESHSVEKHIESVHNPKAVYQDKVNILFSVSPTTQALFCRVVRKPNCRGRSVHAQAVLIVLCYIKSRAVLTRQHCHIL